MKRLFYILMLLLSFLFYWNTGRWIENRTEADDAFEYASMVEAVSHPWLFHPHHLLYGRSMQLLYRGAQAMGYGGRAYPLMILASTLSASGSLFFFFLFCYRRFSLRPVSSLLATGLLAVSYGFWRYAAEAEIVLPASLLGLVALYYATDPDAKPKAFVVAVIFSVLAVLMHIMNAVVVFVAIPAFYLLLRRWKAASMHVLLAAAAAMIAYAWVSHSQSIQTGGNGGVFRHIGIGSFVKACVGLSQCVASADFMMGFRSVRAFLNELFAARMLEEEFYLGARLSRFLVLFSLATYGLFVALLLACAGRAVWVWKSAVRSRSRFRLPTGMAASAVAVVWFICYAGLLLCIEPGNPELWVMGLIPMWLLFCGLILLPLTVDNRLWLAFCALVALLLNNGVGGIGVLRDPCKDYHRQKAAWILENASTNDVVVTAGDPVFERYLRYQFDGLVEYLYDWPEERLESGDLPTSAGEVYVMGDVVDRIASLSVRFPEKSKEIDRYAGKIRLDLEPVVDNEFGGIYRPRPTSGRIP